MIRIQREHHFAVPVEAGFAFITDLANWPEYWPGFVRIEPVSQWSAPGDEPASSFGCSVGRSSFT